MALQQISFPFGDEELPQKPKEEEIQPLPRPRKGPDVPPLIQAELGQDWISPEMPMESLYSEDQLSLGLESPKDPAEPELPQVPSEPELPKSPAEPELPQVPSEPALPKAPPELPKTPSEPELPQVPSVPETPSFPSKPELPNLPQEPGTPKEPSEPEVPAQTSIPRISLAQARASIYYEEEEEKADAPVDGNSTGSEPGTALHSEGSEDSIVRPGGSSEALPEATVEPEIQTAAEPEVQTAAEPEVQTAAEPEAQTATEPESQTAAEPEAQADAELEAQAAAEPEPEPEPAPVAAAEIKQAKTKTPKIKTPKTLPPDPSAETPLWPEEEEKEEPVSKSSLWPEETEGRTSFIPKKIKIQKGGRGRKSMKELAATVDLVEIPDDDVLFQKQYYSIGEVASMFKVNTSLIRFWETEFTEIRPRKNKKGDRSFSPMDIKIIQLIHFLLRQKKLTIEGAKEYLKAHNKDGNAKLEMIRSMEKIKAFLLELKARL